MRCRHALLHAYDIDPEKEGLGGAFWDTYAEYMGM